jgi:hypothetical protein
VEEDGEDGYLSSGDDLGPAEVGHGGSNSDGERFLQVRHRGVGQVACMVDGSHLLALPLTQV